MKSYLTAALVAAIAVGAAGSANAAEQLGCQSVGFIADRDRIAVGRE